MMCKKTYRHEQMTAAAGAYEGQTIRIGSSDEPRGARHHSDWVRGFPWWSLWLIWPLIGVLKWAAPVSVSPLATLRDSLGAFERPATALVALALVAAGVVLIRR